MEFHTVHAPGHCCHLQLRFCALGAHRWARRLSNVLRIPTLIMRIPSPSAEAVTCTQTASLSRTKMLLRDVRLFTFVSYTYKTLQ